MQSSIFYKNLETILYFLTLLQHLQVVYNHPVADIVTVEKIETNSSFACHEVYSEIVMNNTEYNESVTETDDLIIPIKINSVHNNSAMLNYQTDLLTSDEDLSELYVTTITVISKSRIDAVPINMSDFLALIPVADTQIIVNNYYRHDLEVQRAFFFLISPEYAQLKLEATNAPEMFAFLKFFQNSGLDLLYFLHSLSNLITVPGNSGSTVQTATDADNKNNDMQAFTSDTGIFFTNTVELTSEPMTANLQINKLSGLHGMIENILDILPQDLILTTFFDKLENNEQFSHLISSIGSAKFASIYSNLQQSEAFINLIYVLQNNGIDLSKIMQLFQSYFLLGAL